MVKEAQLVSEAKLKATKGTGLKILAPKQILQRLPIVLAQVNVITQKVY